MIPTGQPFEFEVFDRNKNSLNGTLPFNARRSVSLFLTPQLVVIFNICGCFICLAFSRFNHCVLVLINAHSDGVTTHLVVYAKYWLVNHTARPLVYSKVDKLIAGGQGAIFPLNMIINKSSLCSSLILFS